MAVDSMTRRFIGEIIEQQLDLTLATVRPDGYPQANTVSYAHDGLTLYFASARDSRKVRNIEACDKVSLAINVPYYDTSSIKALSMAGRATLLAGGSPEQQRALELLATRFPDVNHLALPADLNEVACVRIVPELVSVIDYSKGPPYARLVRVATFDLQRPTNA